MRLHAQIFATTMHAPLLGVSFEPKSSAWLAVAGADRVTTDEITPRHVAAWLSALTHPAVPAPPSGGAVPQVAPRQRAARKLNPSAIR
jgi:hypothetical protein